MNPQPPYPQTPLAKSNKKLWIILGIVIGIPTILMGGCVACVALLGLSGANNPSLANSNVRPASSITPLANLNSNQGISASVPQNFAANVVCSLPQQVAPNTPFANLGGGTWGRWGDSNGELDYGCNGGKDSITLKDDGNVNITAEYGAIGGPQIAHYISVEYSAFQYTGQTPTEKQLRQQYADFCDKLSEKLYGVKLPAQFRRRLLDESTYSPTSTANEYAEKVGSGYVNLSSNKNKALMIMLDVHFFSSEAEYKAYKDE